MATRDFPFVRYALSFASLPSEVKQLRELAPKAHIAAKLERDLTDEQVFSFFLFLFSFFVFMLSLYHFLQNLLIINFTLTFQKSTRDTALCACCLQRQHVGLPRRYGRPAWLQGLNTVLSSY